MPLPHLSLPHIICAKNVAAPCSFPTSPARVSLSTAMRPPQIIRIHARKMNISPDINYEELARRCVGDSLSLSYHLIVGESPIAPGGKGRRGRRPFNRFFANTSHIHTCICWNSGREDPTTRPHLCECSTDDFNAAQLKAICVEAGMLALRRDATEVNHEDFVEGITQVGGCRDIGGGEGAAAGAKVNRLLGGLSSWGMTGIGGECAATPTPLVCRCRPPSSLK